jgi:hypothetical protein
MIGKNAGNCLFDQRKYFDKITKLRKSDDDQRNLDECDVVSTLEEKFDQKTIKFQNKLDCAQRKLKQCYLQTSWKDYAFIKALKTNETLLNSTHNRKSFTAINETIDDCIITTETLIVIVKTFSWLIRLAHLISFCLQQKELHARSPLYTYNRKMFPDPRYREQVEMTKKFRLQYKTRCDMFSALEDMHECRAKGDLKKLIKIAEHELGVHYQIRSRKVMPRKEEFTSEICNLIGLAHLDKLKKPQADVQIDGWEFLAAMLGISIEQSVSVYIFGNQSTYQDPTKLDSSFLTFKRHISHLEDRLKLSSMSIEKCYLYHEMGKRNFNQNRHDASRHLGYKVVDEASRIGSYLWEFLGQILIFRANVKQKNKVLTIESLTAASKIVDLFKNPALSDIISSALTVKKLKDGNWHATTMPLNKHWQESSLHWHATDLNFHLQFNFFDGWQGLVAC